MAGEMEEAKGGFSFVSKTLYNTSIPVSSVNISITSGSIYSCQLYTLSVVAPDEPHEQSNATSIVAAISPKTIFFNFFLFSF